MARRKKPIKKPLKKKRILPARVPRRAPLLKKRIPKWRIIDSRTNLRYTPSESARQIDYARSAIKLLRRFFTGYSADDGFDLRQVKWLTTAQFNKLRHYAPYFNELTGQPYKVVSGRSARVAKVLRKRTGQKFRNQTAFVIPVTSPETVRYRVTRSGLFEMRRKVKGAVVVKREYLFPREPDSFADLIGMTEDMMPDLPEGYYVAITKSHGLTGAPSPKNLLIKLLEGWEVSYEIIREQKGRDDPQGFAEAIIGFQLTSVEREGMLEEWRERLTSRGIYRREMMLVERRRADERYRLHVLKKKRHKKARRSKRAKVRGRL